MFKKLNNIKKKALALTLSLAMLFPVLSGSMAVNAAAGSVTHFAQYSWTDSNGRHLTLGEFTVSTGLGEAHAWCAEHFKNPPHEGQEIASVEESKNDNLRKVLWYGVFGPGMMIGNTHEECSVTELATSIANGHTEDLTSPEAYEFYNQVVAMPSPPSGFHVYLATMTNSEKQSLAFYMYTPKGYLELNKASGNTAMTEGNSCYSLEGAVYGIYSGSTEVARITTDANGYAKSGELDAGDYTIKEISASKGFAVDTQSYNVKVTGGGVTSVKVAEPPTNDPAALELVKIDQGTGGDAQGKASLEGAEFTVKYYNGFYTKDTLPETPTRTWVIQTKGIKNSAGDTVYMTRLDDSYKVSGDDFYYSEGNNNPTLPLGTITVQETKAPQGYMLDGAYLSAKGSTEKVTGLYVAQITQDGNLGRLQGGNEYTVSDRIIRGDFEFTKRDAETSETMAGIPFKITSNTTKESHTIVTDENGYWSSSSDYIKHTQDTNGGTANSGTWFGTEKADDSKGALPYDTYTVEEQRCDANEGKALVKFTVTISRDGFTVDMGTVDNSDLTLSTTAKDQDTNSHYSFADNEVTIVDEVRYTGVKKGSTYKLVGTLMNRETGQPVTDSKGNPVTAEKSFKAPTAEGTVEVEFTFDASQLAGADVVVFEKLYLGSELITSHEDITDEDQTVHFPGIETTAIGDDTKDNITNASKEIVIKDTVAFKNLRTSKTYTVTGVLMDKDTGKEALDADGNKITAKAEFKPETSSGTVEVTFKFDGSNLAGHTLVAFETVENKGKTYAVHADIEDEDQTVYIPEIGTTAKDKETGTQNMMAADKATIIDTVEYKNVIPGREMTVKGVLMDKKTGKELLINGEPVTAEKTFTPEKSEGTVDIEFTFNAVGLEGESIVVFEDLYLNGVIVASHTDIEDEGQTILIPEIGTTATDEESGTHMAKPDEKVTIEDEVAFKNLIPGTTYTVHGKLMDKATGAPLMDGDKEVTGETTFTPEKSEGTVKVIFEFNASALAGETVVAFESLTVNEKEIAVHEDITDEDQSVHFPEIKTTATDREDGDHEALANDKVVIVDKVEYKNVVPGQELTVKGTLMDKETGKELLSNGKPVTAETTFTPDKSSGTVEVTFEFNGVSLGGKTTVAFESLEANGKEVAVHTDINDEGQSVKLKTPPQVVIKTGDNMKMYCYAGAGIVLLAAGLLFIFIKKRKGN